MLNPRFFKRASLFVCLLTSVLAQAAGVRQFSPQGQVDQQIRATAVFGADMVRLGDANAAAPFDVDCGEVKGRSRWGDARSWSYTLERALRTGERCDFHLKAGLKALNGEMVDGEPAYVFFAPGPWPRSLMPRPGSPIEEDQAFLVDVSATVKRESVESKVWCEADGVGNRIPVRVLPAAQRDAVIGSVYRDASPDALLLTCAERLPAGAKMRLVWGKGVETADAPVVSSGREESFSYLVREPFRASFSCEREKASAPCSSLSAMRVDFSAPVDAKMAARATLKTADGLRAPQAQDGEGARENTVSSIRFNPPFAQNSEFAIDLPKALRDEAGRSLENVASFPLKVRTGSLPPLAKFPGAFGIVELKEGGLVPVTLRNVEALLPVADLKLPGSEAHRLSAQRLTDDGEVITAIRALAQFEQQTRTFKVKAADKEAEDGEQEAERFDPYYARELSFLNGKAGVASQSLPKPGGSAEFEVVGIPLVKPGFHIVEIESQLLGEALLASPKPMYVRTSALVTNMAVHLKRGKDNALVWVTSLDGGKPVADAEVRVSDCNGNSLWQGRSDSLGRALIDKALPDVWCEDAGFLFASARLGDDYSFVRSDWNEGIEPWRFGVQTWGDYSARKIHTIFDRSLLRAGQTVSMKHIARERGSHDFAMPAMANLPTELVLRHDGSGDEFRQPLNWDKRGVATSQWKIPESAKRGTYTVELVGAPDGQGGDIGTGRFSVSDFRLPAFAGSVQGVPGHLVAPKEVPLALGLSYLNGGAAKGAKVEVSATLRPRWPEYAGYDGFSFRVDFGDEGLAAFAVDDGREREQLVASRLPVTLDGAGAGRVTVPMPGKIKGPSELYAEMTFADPNGEIQTLHGSVELAPAAVIAGIRVADWASVAENGKVEVVVLDVQGKPLANAPVKIDAKRRVDYSHRKRIVGGFYAYENHTEFTDLGKVCEGRSDARGKFICEPRTTEPGNVYLLAQTSDAAGNTAYAGASYWVSGKGDLWFTAGNQDRIDLIPEKRSYAPGETARLQVRTPFREATALVSVEAGGIVDTQVVELSRFKPVIEVPVKGEWGPNVFISVLAVRGRVQPLKWYSLFQWGWREPAAWFKEWWNPLQPTAMVDLAKPAYRIGLAAIDVGVDAFRLKVDVVPEKAEYAPRDQAQVRIKVTQPDGKPAPAGTELAFAAVDQALLELRPNESWELLDAMLPTRAYQVQTATAQSQVIGKRHFGKKALPPGGGGGRAPARELFDTLLLWNPRVVLDEKGEALLSVPLNDSLTEFALVAVADAGVRLFGTGRASLRSKQDLQLIAGLPPLVREKDQFSALLTLRNATAKAMNVSVTAKTATAAGEQALETKALEIAPESATEVAWQATVPENENALTWTFDAVDKGGVGRDSLRITQQIIPAVPVTVQQASFSRVDGTLDIPATIPDGAVSGKTGPLGGIEVGLSARLSTPPPGLARFFERYPFVCLEQLTSVAIGLRDTQRWQRVVSALPTYLDANGLAQYFPGEGRGNAGSPALTAYLLDVSSAAGFVIPADIAQRMESGLAAFAEGRIKPAHWSPVSDILVRKLSAIEALTRRGQAPLSAISSLEIDPLRLPTSALIDWYLIANRLEQLPQREERLAAVSREIRNRLSYLGARLVFTNERADYWWWLMVSGDANAFRLIEAVLDDPAWQEDLPALVQGALMRQQRGRWLTTVANAWASIALDKFGNAFEKEVVTGTTRATLAGSATQAFAWPAKEAAGNANKLLLPWPAKAASSDVLQLTHEGSGKPLAAMQVLAAVPVTEAVANGFHVTRTAMPVQEKEAGKVSRGDVWRVRLEVESDQEMSWVVVNDPIPAGARILGEGDGRDSHIAGIGEQSSGNAWPAYVERTFSAYRAYYSYVPHGRFAIDYTLRLNNAGEFSLPATRVEAMYAPEVFGEQPNENVIVRE